MDDPRANLASALDAYLQHLQFTSGHSQLVEQLTELRGEIESIPNPVRQGPGSVPEQKPGSSGARPAWPLRDTVVAAMTSSNEAPSGE